MTQQDNMRQSRRLQDNLCLKSSMDSCYLLYRFWEHHRQVEDTGQVTLFASKHSMLWVSKSSLPAKEVPSYFIRLRRWFTGGDRVWSGAVFGYALCTEFSRTGKDQGKSSHAINHYSSRSFNILPQIIRMYINICNYIYIYIDWLYIIYTYNIYIYIYMYLDYIISIFDRLRHLGQAPCCE